MPWNVTDVMEQKIRFVTQAAVPGANISALCRESGISRPTGYYWLKRYREADSVAGLQERSRRPKHSPRRTAGWVEARVVQLRRQHGWGGKKLQVLLQREGVHLSGPKPRRGQSSFRRGVLGREGDSHHLDEESWDGGQTGGIPNLQNFATDHRSSWSRGQNETTPMKRPRHAPPGLGCPVGARSAPLARGGIGAEAEKGTVIILDGRRQ